MFSIHHRGKLFPSDRCAQWSAQLFHWKIILTIVVKILLPVLRAFTLYPYATFRVFTLLTYREKAWNKKIKPTSRNVKPKTVLALTNHKTRDGYTQVQSWYNNIITIYKVWFRCGFSRASMLDAPTPIKSLIVVNIWIIIVKKTFICYFLVWKFSLTFFRIVGFIFKFVFLCAFFTDILFFCGQNDHPTPPNRYLVTHILNGRINGHARDSGA